MPEEMTDLPWTAGWRATQKCNRVLSRVNPLVDARAIMLNALALTFNALALTFNARAHTFNARALTLTHVHSRSKAPPMP